MRVLQEARSLLYCYLLSAEDRRDEDTRAIHFMDCQNKGLKPERTIGDDAKGLVSAHKIVFPEVPCHYDNFHLSRGLMKRRRYFRNRLKTAICERNYLEKQSQQWSGDENKCQQWIDVNDDEEQTHYISKTLDTLILLGHLKRTT
jgi:hypothetical protein